MAGTGLPQGSQQSHEIAILPSYAGSGHTILRHYIWVQVVKHYQQKVVEIKADVAQEDVAKQIRDSIA